jgi:8-oxo-dGTP pyrophosphatase MutT (NUDIX family)
LTSVSNAKAFQVFYSICMKQKILAYIYRDSFKQELLVFDHCKYPEVSPQVIGGTIDIDESPEDAVIREVFEEAGIKVENPKLVGSFLYYRADIKQHQMRHVFEFISSELPSSWTHNVSSGEEDKGMEFHFYWSKVENARKLLVADMGTYLET